MINRSINNKLVFADEYATISYNPNFLANQLSKIVPSLQYLEPTHKKDKFLAKTYNITINSLKICDSFMSPTRIASTNSNDYTLMVPIKGRCVTTVENKDYEWSEKTYAYFKPKCEGKSVSTNNRNVILFDIIPEEFNKHAKIMLNEKVKQNLFDFENPHLILLNSFGISFNTIILQLCKIIGANLHSIQDLEKSRFDEVIYRLLVMMFFPKKFFIDEKIKHTNKISTSMLKLVKELQHENYFSVMTLSDLEQFLDLSTRNLQLFFKKHFNITPTQFLREQKLKYAKQLLIKSKGELSITQIALETGFFNFTQFTKYYIEYHGVLPSETKKLAK